MELPKELRLLVLEHSDLVDSRFGSVYQQYLSYEDGRLRIHNRHADWGEHTNPPWSCDFCPHILSPSLLLVNKELRKDGLEIMITKNLLVLYSGFAQNLEFLMSLPRVTRSRIEHLDIKFAETDWADNQSPCAECCVFHDIPTFDRLIEYIGGNLNLSRLHLTLDLLERFKEYKYMNHLENTLGESALMLRAFKRLGKSLHRLNGIRSFMVYSAMFTEYEEDLECIGMGQADYDSLEHGKVPISLRFWPACHVLPHYNESEKKWTPRMVPFLPFWDVGTRVVELANDHPQQECEHSWWFEGYPLIPMTLRSYR